MNQGDQGDLYTYPNPSHGLLTTQPSGSRQWINAPMALFGTRARTRPPCGSSPSSRFVQVRCGHGLLSACVKLSVTRASGWISRNRASRKLLSTLKATHRPGRAFRNAWKSAYLWSSFGTSPCVWPCGINGINDSVFSPRVRSWLCCHI